MAIDLKSCCSRSCRLVCTNTTTLSPRSAQVHQDSAVLTYFNLASLDYAKCCFVECKWRTELRPKRSPCDCAKSLRKTRLLFVLASFSAVSVGSGLDLHLRGKNSSSQNLDVQGAPIKTGPFWRGISVVIFGVRKKERCRSKACWFRSLAALNWFTAVKYQRENYKSLWRHKKLR